MNAILKKESSSNFEHYVCGNCTFPYKTKPEADACCSGLARENFQKRLKLRLNYARRLIDEIEHVTDTAGNDLYLDPNAKTYRKEIEELFNKSDGYPLTWQPPKEGESLL